MSMNGYLSMTWSQQAQTSRSAGSAALSVGEISVSSSIDDGSLTPTFMSKHEEEEEEPLVKLKRKYIER